MKESVRECPRPSDLSAGSEQRDWHALESHSKSRYETGAVSSKGLVKGRGDANMLRAIPAARSTFLRRSRRYWVSGAVLVLLLLAGHAERVHAEKLRDSVKKQSVSVRLIGRASSLPVTTFGANYQSFVAALHAPNGDISLVKLVYRFLSYDHGLPAAFMDYDYVHRFRAVRQLDCDEAADTVLYSRHASPAGEMPGRDFTFEYAKGAADTRIPSTGVLPCYVVTPADYQGSTHLPRTTPIAIVAKKKSDGASKAP
jgi:hypothetical protein